MTAITTTDKEKRYNKVSVINRLYTEFNEDNDILFEQLYSLWNAERSLPPIQEVCDAINDSGCDWIRFYNYFNSVL